MMDFDTWIDGIISTIEIFADENIQRRVWVEGDTDIFSSWEEAYCQLFDDSDLLGFIDTYCCTENQKLPASTCASLKEFQEAAKNYGDKWADFADPKAVLSDPEWHQVRILAKKALDDLRMS
jgi:hypothetical protein